MDGMDGDSIELVDWQNALMRAPASSVALASADQKPSVITT